MDRSIFELFNSQQLGLLVAMLIVSFLLIRLVPKDFDLFGKLVIAFIIVVVLLPLIPSLTGDAFFYSGSEKQIPPGKTSIEMIFSDQNNGLDYVERKGTRYMQTMKITICLGLILGLIVPRRSRDSYSSRRSIFDWFSESRERRSHRKAEQHRMRMEEKQIEIDREREQRLREEAEAKKVEAEARRIRATSESKKAENEAIKNHKPRKAYLENLKEKEKLAERAEALGLKEQATKYREMIARMKDQGGR